MFYFKACLRCHGDLYKGADVYGPYISCVQCSHYLTEAEETRLKLSASRLVPWLGSLTQREKQAA